MTVSVIVSVYNTKKYLARCVDSILAQTFADFELILVDDGSTDGSGALCDACAARDARVRVIRQENRGVSAARNRGIGQAAGQYVCFVDSDDTVTADYLQCLLDGAGEDTLSVVGVAGCPESGTGAETADGACCSVPLDAEHAPQIGELIAGHWLDYACAKLYVRAILTEAEIRFDETMSKSEDSVFVADYLRRVGSCRICERRCYHYIHHAAGTTLSTVLRDDLFAVAVTTVSRLEACMDAKGLLFGEVKTALNRRLLIASQETADAWLTAEGIPDGRKIALLNEILRHPRITAVVRDGGAAYPEQADFYVFRYRSGRRLLSAYRRRRLGRRIRNKLIYERKRRQRGTGRAGNDGERGSL